MAPVPSPDSPRLPLPARSWLLVALLACGGGEKSGGGGGDGAGADGADGTDGADGSDGSDGGPAPSYEGACPMETHQGGFIIEAYDDYSVVDGTFRDGVIPNTVLQPIGQEGDCTLLQRINPFCDPPCAASETCSIEAECIPFPSGQDLGTVTVTGLAVPVEMAPVQPGYRYFTVSLPYPGFEPGALIRLESTGGSYEPLLLDSVGIEPLALGELQWTVTAGQALPITWSAPTVTTPATVELEITIDQHGTSPFVLQCSFEDDGAGEVPAALLDTLVSHGVSGFPNGSLERRVADSATLGGGCVDLRLATPLIPDVRVAGFTACDEDADCPEGLECNEAIELCE